MKSSGRLRRHDDHERDGRGRTSRARTTAPYEAAAIRRGAALSPPRQATRDEPQPSKVREQRADDGHTKSCRRSDESRPRQMPRGQPVASEGGTSADSRHRWQEQHRELHLPWDWRGERRDPAAATPASPERGQRDAGASATPTMSATPARPECRRRDARARRRRPPRGRRCNGSTGHGREGRRPRRGVPAPQRLVGGGGGRACDRWEAAATRTGQQRPREGGEGGAHGDGRSTVCVAYLRMVTFSL